MFLIQLSTGNVPILNWSKDIFWAIANSDHS